jgi:hypothetical protein
VSEARQPMEDSQFEERLKRRIAELEAENAQLRFILNHCTGNSLDADVLRLNALNMDHSRATQTDSTTGSV